MVHRLPTQRFASIGVRRSALAVVPWRLAAIAKLSSAARPRPQLHQCVRPKVQMKSSQVAPHVAQLLLSDSPYLFDVVKHLLYRRTISVSCQDFLNACIWSGAKKHFPAFVLIDLAFFDQHNSQPSTHNGIRGQERLARLGNRFASVQNTFHFFPAGLLARLFDQRNCLLAILAFSSFCAFFCDAGTVRRPASFRKRLTTTTPAGRIFLSNGR